MIEVVYDISIQKSSYYCPCYTLALANPVLGYEINIFLLGRLSTQYILAYCSSLINPRCR